MTGRRKVSADAVLGAIRAPERLDSDLARINDLLHRKPAWSVPDRAALAFQQRLKLGEEGFGGVRQGLWGRCPGCGVDVQYRLGQAFAKASDPGVAAGQQGGEGLLHRLKSLFRRLFRHRPVSPPRAGRSVAWPPEDVQ